VPVTIDHLFFVLSGIAGGLGISAYLYIFFDVMPRLKRLEDKERKP
jgi:phage shock protein PspC (stress-responsive transcriptional regulator)